MKPLSWLVSKKGREYLAKRKALQSSPLQAKEETYPAEFCLWVAKKCCNQEMSVTPEELFDFMGNEYTLPELFKYWKEQK